MANNNIEIEIKLPISKKQSEELIRKLGQSSKKIGTSRQIDDYYTPPHKNFFKPDPPVEYLRIRKSQKGDSFNYKYWYTNKKGVSTHCDEYETVIKNVQELEKILKVLKFKKIITIDKKRVNFIYQEKYKISLDTVQKLGNFIEIEALLGSDNIQKTRSELFNLAKELGVETSEPDKNGYVYLLMKKEGLIR
ncbi:class IV adenylate cyclase [Candidatus Dojkabacteria bacterium]|nr:class IV adenylate cyclase [Candidatus Dojkabacteria bacterium]